MEVLTDEEVNVGLIKNGEILKTFLPGSFKYDIAEKLWAGYYRLSLLPKTNEKQTLSAQGQG